jgi:hypothetical protein
LRCSRGLHLRGAYNDDDDCSDHNIDNDHSISDVHDVDHNDYVNDDHATAVDNYDRRTDHNHHVPTGE